MRRAVLAALALTVAAGTVPAAGQSQLPSGAAGRRDERPREERNQPVTVDSDKMERFGKQGLVVFSGNVVARHNNSIQYADRMEIYLDEKGDRVVRTVSTGAVRIVTNDCRTATARRAEYYDIEQRVVLSGNARVWQEDNVVSGETITIHLAQDLSVVEGGKQERVKAVFQPKDDKKDDRNDQVAVLKTPAATCKN